MKLNGFKKEIEKIGFIEGVDPAVWGLIIGAALGGTVGRKKILDMIQLAKKGVKQTVEAVGKKAEGVTEYAAPISGGVIGALAGALMRNPEGTTIIQPQQIIAPSAPKQELVRVLTTPGVKNVYGDPSYNPRF